MRLTPARRLLSILALFVFAIAPERRVHAAGYTENVTFSIRMSETRFSGPVSEVYILIDRFGGRNRLQAARRLTNAGGDRWQITIPLEEGDYIYTFAANPRQYVDLNNPDLNPDDVPHANFFNDPHPRFPGYGGQYSTDNIYQVRDPDNPKLDPATSTPKGGALITSSPVSLSFRVNRGTSGRPIDGTTARIRLELNEVYGLTPGPLAPPEVTFRALTGVTFREDGSGGVISGSLTAPPEGLHILQVDIKSIDQRSADTLKVPLFINLQNQAPIADAGASRFTVIDRWTEVDGGNSRDPDNIGFSAFAWRKVSGPGNMTIRTIAQEPRNDDPNQRRGDGVPVIDADGNSVGDPLPATGAVPQLRFDRAGDYVVGLVVTDKQGLPSREATTTVRVSQSYDGSIRLRLHAGKRGGRVIVSAFASDLPDATPIRFMADDSTPIALNPVAGSNGREVELMSPAPGAYFVHAQAGNQSSSTSYPAQVIVVVKGDGSIEGRDIARPPRSWKEDAVLYLLFVREFANSRGDPEGEGDLKGAIQNLPWLKRLGVNTIWMMPVEPGGTTAGYSMDSFFAIHSDYGTFADLREFLQRAHEAGIKVVLDLVLDHTSARHPWFTMALGNVDSVTRDRYYFRPDGSYMYAFSFVGLPETNYNNPIVRASSIDRAKFWMDLGFDGFRCDIAGFTPTSIWRQIRREVLKRNVAGFMLAEMIPPIQDYVEAQFDAMYDPATYWETRDGFAGNSPFSNLDNALKSAQRWIQSAGRQELRDRLDANDLIRMHYLDNQDEDRFLLKAGGSKDRQKVAAAVELTLPGMPLITYGDEVAMVQGRGRMNFNRDPDMTAHYRRYVRIRNGNPGLRDQSTDNPGAEGNSYARLSSDGDLNANQIFSFLRRGHNQVFVVLANRSQSSVIGTPVTYYVGQDVLNLLPDGPLVMTNHAQPSDVLQVTKAQLLGGHMARVGSYETKVYQLSNVQIPDQDNDGILDSYDTCVGVPNGADYDDDYDGVANACDHCSASPPGSDVGMDGCPRGQGGPRPVYQLEGQPDDERFRVGEANGLKLYASFNGKVLYVAMTGAVAGQEHILYLRDPAANEPLAQAPFNKLGRAAARWAMLDEGRGDRALWQGPWVGTKIGKAGPLGSGVVESTVNLVERYGSGLPEKIAIAGVRYQPGRGAVVAQVPAARTVDNDITPDEFFEFTLVRPVITPADNVMPAPDGGVMPGLDAGSPRPGTDGGPAPGSDGSTSSTAPLCPNARPGVPVDSNGCEIVNPPPPSSAFDDGPRPSQTLGCGCRASAATRPGSGRAVEILAAVLAIARARRRSRPGPRAIDAAPCPPVRS